jgi:hypothetical protein
MVISAGCCATVGIVNPGPLAATVVIFVGVGGVVAA